MNNEVRRIAEQAGFIFWGDEEWRPSDGNVIDWGNDYTREFEKFVELYREYVLRKEKEAHENGLLRLSP